jgi:geranylgeranyl diphosphate synthase type I
MPLSIVDVLAENGKLIDELLLEVLNAGASDSLYAIVKHQVSSGGKRVRPVMTILCCQAVGGDAKTALPAAAAVELVHNYTLILDDIIDHSELRRGLPTIRAKYGDVMAILAGMYYREAVFDAAKKCPKSKLIEESLGEALKKIIEGERLDVLFEQAGREEQYIQEKMYRSISTEDYFRMIGKKTAALFEAACKVGGLVGDGKPDQVDALSEFGWNCGMAFQIMDDVLDITGKKEKFGKDIGKDVKEHKLGNLAILCSLEELSADKAEELLSILRLPEISESEVEKALRIISSTNAAKRAHRTSNDFVMRAINSLNTLPSSDSKEALHDLAYFICRRSY